MTTATITRVPECTPEQAAQWSAQFSEGARVARGDVLWNAGPRIPLIEIPPEDPYETGSRYVTRWVHLAWQIGYTHAYRYETRGN
jgi:urease accessory protein UreE